jgi:hypothetical protein
MTRSVLFLSFFSCPLASFEGSTSRSVHGLCVSFETPAASGALVFCGFDRVFVSFETSRLTVAGTKGESLRGIAAVTSLSLSTVRTILRDKPMVDRKLHRQELDRARANIYRARKRQREQLPSSINANLERNAELLKASKGLAEV